MANISVAVNFSDSESIELEISPMTTVAELKAILRASLKFSREETDTLVVIFAGKVLPDDQTLDACFVRDATLLHAILRPSRPVQESSKLQSTSEDSTVHHELIPTDKVKLIYRIHQKTPVNLLQSELFVHTRDKLHDGNCFPGTFYGFCKEVCKDVTPALLRFACEKCGRSSFVVDATTELDAWDDILDRAKVRGTCYANCDSDLANLVFKCAAHRSRGQMDQTVYLRQVKLNVDRTHCSACDDMRTPVLNFSCDPTHLMCLECFHQYGVTLLSERHFVSIPNVGYTIRCPIGCTNGVVFDPHHFYLLGQRQYEIFKEFGAEECFLRDGGSYCAEPMCGLPFIDDSSIYFIICPKGHRFCRNCGETAHAGSCEAMAQRTREATTETALDNARSRRTIERTSRPCPGCRVTIERNGGCMHVICSRCSKEFCWICGTDWGVECMARHWFA